MDESVEDEAVARIRRMRAMVSHSRTEWTISTSAALNELAAAAIALRDALGEISRDEAIDALKARAVELIEAVR